MTHTTLRRNSKELKRAWAELAKVFGDISGPDNDAGGEMWQYMGTHDGVHQFRHRNHPKLGRIVHDVHPLQAA